MCVFGSGWVISVSVVVLKKVMREKVAGGDEEADEYADEADGADDVGTCYDAAVQY